MINNKNYLINQDKTKLCTVKWYIGNAYYYLYKLIKYLLDEARQHTHFTNLFLLNHLKVYY